VAIDDFNELQVTFLLVAFAGKTFAVSLATLPSTNSNLSLSNVTPVTGIILLVTSISQVAVLLPSSVVIVIVVFPALIALTFPFLSTLATDSSLEFQVTFLLVAFSGKIVAFSWSVSLSTNFNELLSNLTLLTAIVFCFCLPQLDNTIGVTTLVDNTPIVENNIDLINFIFILSIYIFYYKLNIYYNYRCKVSKQKFVQILELIF